VWPISSMTSIAIFIIFSFARNELNQPRQQMNSKSTALVAYHGPPNT